MRPFDYSTAGIGIGNSPCRIIYGFQFWMGLMLCCGVYLRCKCENAGEKANGGSRFHPAGQFMDNAAQYGKAALAAPLTYPKPYWNL